LDDHWASISISVSETTNINEIESEMSIVKWWKRYENSLIPIWKQFILISGNLRIVGPNALKNRVVI
jgi:hypothetical protein